MKRVLTGMEICISAFCLRLFPKDCGFLLPDDEENEEPKTINTISLSDEVKDFLIERLAEIMDVSTEEIEDAYNTAMKKSTGDLSNAEIAAMYALLRCATEQDVKKEIKEMGFEEDK